MSSSNYAGCPSENYDSTDKNCCDAGDGDGDGDCVDVVRDMVFSLDFNSGVLGQNDVPSSPAFVIPPGAVSLPIDFSPLAGSPAPGGGHSSWAGGGPFIEIDISDDPAFDQPFELTFNYSMSQTVGAGANDITYAAEANYGGGWFPLRQWINSLGGSNPDELLGMTFTTMIPSLEMAQDTGIPGAVSTPLVRMVVSRSGNGALIEITNRQMYAKQIFPQFTAVTVNNCEAGEVPSCLLPETATIVDPSGGMGPAPVVYPFSGEAGWSLRVEMADTFDPSLYTPQVLLDGVPQALGVAPLFATISTEPAGPPGTQTTWVMGFTTPPGGTPPTTVALSVTENADPECTWGQLAMSVPES